ncbi:hypothetical protein DFP72DRAFT_289415 [Ephemerocybe angulata]|uniref:Nephrocystin 3-like N-terminal domain-containing protein n=1 Tax=Ephemerocybe angulata TaxID=980116 RepID=A0A8H6H884_9AGAR|nr:hypothetical protein DFP72DRAFT_289415 [Tulosesus angulatus]
MISKHALQSGIEHQAASETLLPIRRRVLDKCTKWISAPHRPGSTKKFIVITSNEPELSSETLQALALKCVELDISSSSFHFSSSDPTRNCLARLVPTIAYQLGTTDPSLRDRISTAVDGNPLIFNHKFFQQLDFVLVQPARIHAASGRMSNWRHVVLIDSLEQCNLGDQGTLIHAIKSCILKKDINTPFRIVIASRPDSAISSYLAGKDSNRIIRIDLDERILAAQQRGNATEGDRAADETAVD